MTPEGDPRKELIFEKSRRALEQQEAVLDNLRSRTGLVLTAASIASSFLGAAALKDGHWCGWTVLALLCFVGVGWFSVGGILWPKQDGWTFSHSVDGLLASYIDSGEWDIDAMRVAMAERQQLWWASNKTRLDDMFEAFRWACVALLGSVCFWLLDLALCG